MYKPGNKSDYSREHNACWVYSNVLSHCCSTTVRLMVGSTCTSTNQTPPHNSPSKQHATLLICGAPGHVTTSTLAVLDLRESMQRFSPTSLHIAHMHMPKYGQEDRNLRVQSSNLTQLHAQHKKLLNIMCRLEQDSKNTHLCPGERKALKVY